MAGELSEGIIMMYLMDSDARKVPSAHYHFLSFMVYVKQIFLRGGLRNWKRKEDFFQ